MFTRTIATITLVLIPTVAAAQRGGGGGGGGFGGSKQANWDEINKGPGKNAGLQLSNRDVENISPVRLLVEKRKDLKLSDDQLNKLKELDAKLKDKNESLFKAMDSLRKEMRPPAKPSDDDRSRMMSARREVTSVLTDIRANYEAALKEAMPLLDEAQQKTAKDLLQKQDDEATEMLKEKLGGRGGGA